MTLSELKVALPTLQELRFELPNGELVPSHFHLTEIGEVTRKFIDCGGTFREHKVTNFQLWTADDYDHRLAPQKLANIIKLAEKHLNLGDHEIEVEYQGETIGKYHLDVKDGHLALRNTHTACLAQDACGVPALATTTSEKPAFDLAGITAKASGCTPGGGCC